MKNQKYWLEIGEEARINEHFT